MKIVDKESFSIAQFYAIKALDCTYGRLTRNDFWDYALEMLAEAYGL